jgi:hypothetical protein
MFLTFKYTLTSVYTHTSICGVMGISICQPPKNKFNFQTTPLKS